MSDEKENFISETVKAVEGIVKAVPVYQDAIQPAAKEVGKSLEIVAKCVNVALAPISGLVWGYESIRIFVLSRVAEKLKDIPQNRIITPSPLVAGPLLEALRYAGHEEVLRELYANLLATSIDSETAEKAHPGFVEILKNMSPDEAKIMKFFATNDGQPLIDVKANVLPDGFKILFKNFSFIGILAGCQYPNLTPNYLDNLGRLGLAEIPFSTYILNEDLYQKLISSSELDSIKKYIDSVEGWTIDFNKKKIELTSLGKQFCFACVIDKNIQSEQS